ncbi:hypothetical protein V496_05095, partial [Pseudogymnoascus sp. VKM F-4515 (FW-2607)]
MFRRINRSNARFTTDSDNRGSDPEKKGNEEREETHPQLRLLILRQRRLSHLLVPLAVLIHDGDGISAARRGAETDEANADAIPIAIVVCLIRIEEAVRRDDATDITKANLPCRADSAAMMTSEIHVEPTHDDGHGGVGAHGDQEERAVLRHDVVVDVEEHGEADHRDAHREEAEGEAVAGAVTEPGYDHGETECSGPRRDGAQLRLDGTVLQAGDNGGREEG